MTAEEARRMSKTFNVQTYSQVKVSIELAAREGHYCVFVNQISEETMELLRIEGYIIEDNVMIPPPFKYKISW